MREINHCNLLKQFTICCNDVFCTCNYADTEAVYIARDETKQKDMDKGLK